MTKSITNSNLKSTEHYKIAERANQSSSQYWVRRLSWLWLAVFGLIGIYLLAQRDLHRASSSDAVQSVSGGGGSVLAGTQKAGTRAIETLRVGDRVLAYNPQMSPADRMEIVEPQWSDWLHLSLSMPKDDGSTLDIELLRPEKWVREQMAIVVAPAEVTAPSTNDLTPLVPLRGEAAGDGAKSDRVQSREPEYRDLVPLSPLRPIFLELAAVGAELELSGEELQALFVEMDLPELAITGQAVVKQIQNAPAIQPGAGRVITATFKHSSGDVLDLRVGDASEPRIASNTLPVVRVAHRPNELGSANSAAESPAKDAAERAEAFGSSNSDDSSQVIGTTSNHPFWSVDRREYVQASKLELGERVLTYSGDTKRVLSKLARPGPQPVYNLEVFAEHVYYVGKDGVLVHNACNTELGDLGEKATKGWLKRNGYTEIGQVQNSSGHGIDIVARHRDGTLTFFEVKTSVGSTAPRLSTAQSDDPIRFITSRLQRAANAGPWWRRTPTAVQVRASEMLTEVQSGLFRRYVVEITNAGDSSVGTTFKIRKWKKS